VPVQDKVWSQHLVLIFFKQMAPIRLQISKKLNLDRPFTPIGPSEDPRVREPKRKVGIVKRFLDHLLDEVCALQHSKNGENLSSRCLSLFPDNLEAF
jgi:hypothetical protein